MQENLLRIGYLGPEGTFTQQAAWVLFPKEHFVPIGDIHSVFSAVSAGKCDIGIVPLDNTTEGPVNATLDALLEAEDLTITALLVLPINHVLMGLTNVRNVEKILAHPQALAQCRKYIRHHYPEAELVPCSSNGEAAAKVASADKPWASIGPATAEKQYGLNIWAQGIQDNCHNSTGFIQIEKSAGQSLGPKPGCRTSIAFSTENRPGALYRMLGIFENNNVNMTKIFSRPMPTQPGQYIFFVDIEDYHVKDAEKALSQVGDEATIYKFLGSYSKRTL